MKNISQRVQEIIDDCNNKLEIESNGNNKIEYNQREIVRRINYYLNDRYLDRDDDAVFWNLSTYRRVHFAKHITPDTKDFLPYGIGTLNHWQSWCLRKKVSQWFDEERFYQTLNSVGDATATYGSSVWKRYKEGNKTKIKGVRLNNIYFDQSVEWIKDADGIVELHQLSKKQLWDKDGVWDNIREVIKKEDKHNYEVWEFYGYYGDEDEKPEYKHVIGYGFGDDFIELWSETVDKYDCPYEDFHAGEYNGRWLRVGVVERLFKLQERANQLVNQNAQASEIASLLLLKSGSPDMVGNVLEQAINGQIIPDSTLEQIGISNVGLNNFLAELQLIENQADKLCFTPDIIQGQASPSNTTFRGIAVENANAVNAFRDIKQNLLEKIADILMEYIFPEVVKDWNHEDIIEMAEDDADVEEYTKALQRKAQIDYLLANEGNVVTEDIKARILQRIEDTVKEQGRSIKIPKNFFNFKWGFKMMPTDETVDKSARNDAYFNALQMTSVNPAITDIPLFRQYCEDNGISAWKLTPKQKEELQQVMNQGRQASGAMPEPKQPDKLLAAAQIQS
ncbi:MAG: hypothetical protein BWY30_01084 [Tenericutes bacterium ADurb.Bin239]|nr:MAG: hypothetical protein BWY30_01084 [Tenericutes bacterium ADurb.Bin239]